MTESSEEDKPLLKVSSRSRHSKKRCHISSESDQDDKKAKTLRKNTHVLENEETKQDLDSGSETYKTTVVSQTPRTSERLRKKASRSFSMPSREKLLDSVSSGKKQNSQRKVKTLKPRKLVNNFLRERTSYVSRGERYDTDDSGLSDFIIDDDKEDESSESSVESDDSDESNKKDSGIRTAKQKSKRQRDKLALESSEQESSYSEDDNVPLQTLKSKIISSQKLIVKTASLHSSDSEESFAPTLGSKTNKRRRVLNCSDSNEDERQDMLVNGTCKKKSEHVGDNDRQSADSIDSLSAKDAKCYVRKQSAASLRPRSKRVQNLTQKHEAKNKKILGSLLKKRQTAKLDAKDRLALKQLSSTNSDSSSAEDEHDPCKEAAEIFLQHSSELEEDDDDRDFIVNAGQSSDEGMNSDGVSQFLKLLDTFTSTGKPVDQGDDNMSMAAGDTVLKRRQKRLKKRKERNASKWRRIKMEDDSEDGDINVDDMHQKRNPSLHVAVLENDIFLVKKLIKEDPDCVYELGHRKRTALHLAALEDKVEFVKLLLVNGSDRTAADCYHLPAIAYAMEGHPDCLRLLLDHTNIKNVSKEMRNNIKGMNLMHFASGEKRDGLQCDDRAKCLELLFSKDKTVCSKLLEERDARTYAPLISAVYAGQHMCVRVLLRMGANALSYKTDDGGNILHFAVECASHFRSIWDADRDTSQCLRELLETTKLLIINDADDHGFTPLMYACESGNSDCVKVLLENGASLKCSDSHGTSSLHLAAMSGDTQCVTLLINSGHQVDCVDRYGWPPLLYANFKAYESCVLALMKPKPEQVFVLGELLKRARSELEKKRTVKVVKNVLVSLANHDAYYTVFNDFIRQNPEMLEENNYGLLQHTWRAILDFDNKRRWFLSKLSQIRGSSYSWSRESLSLEIDRGNVLGSAMNQMGRILGHALRSRSLHVTFKDEPGICTGPKREFFASFCKEVVDPKRGLFIATDDAQFSLVPNAYFAKIASDKTLRNPSQFTAHTCGTMFKQELTSDDCTDEPLIPFLRDKHQRQSTRDESMSVATQDDLITENAADNLQTQDYVANELSDEELMLSLSQTESFSTTTTDDDQTMNSESTGIHSGNGNIRDRHHTAENVARTRQPVLEQSNAAEEEEMTQNDEVGSAGTHSEDDENMIRNLSEPTWISCTENSGDQSSIINVSLRSKLKQLRFIGRMVGFAVCQDLLVNLQLSKPLVKQILGIPMSHPDDLSSFDYDLHRNAVVWLRENSVTELDLPFSVDVMNPWNSKPFTIELSDDPEKKVTDFNKEQYSKLVSQLKLETLINAEVTEFSGGLNEVIPREFLSLFTADEFSLLIGGVTKIDVEDWKKNTKYNGCTHEDDEITWFWKVVWQLKEEEKALLMKFSTGTPCVPFGGFASLTGLGGATKFTIMKIGGLNKIPMASTCFNMLKLTSYSSEKHLKDKLLIAIRHGAEGFSFS